MKNIFQKSSFPYAPGGERYEWKEVETVFTVPRDGLFAIRIEAVAKNAKQNRSTNDDDLRVALDGFDFGKYEVHEEQVSWKGFGASSSWDGASLKGGTKTIYFFVRLQKGSHTLQFFADQTPKLKTIELFEIENNAFELNDLKPDDPLKSNIRGIPWLSFVFLGTLTKTLTLGVRTRSAKTKSATDGDNLKVIVNGNVLQNPFASTSNRYKNFYFSGNLKEFDVLSITPDRFSKPLAFENAVELWYDEEPEITSLKIQFFDDQAFLEYLKSIKSDNIRKNILGFSYLSIIFFKAKRKKYSADFLQHALRRNPTPLVFKNSDPIVKKIKKDAVYLKIIQKIEERIASGNLEGEIWPKDFENDPEMKGQINFNSYDLDTAIHGIRKIEYKVKEKGQNRYEVELTIFDIYDFRQLKASFYHYAVHVNNLLDRGEALGIIHNYPIQIYMKENVNWH